MTCLIVGGIGFLLVVIAFFMGHVWLGASLAFSLLLIFVLICSVVAICVGIDSQIERTGELISKLTETTSSYEVQINYQTKTIPEETFYYFLICLDGDTFKVPVSKREFNRYELKARVRFKKANSEFVE